MADSENDKLHKHPDNIDSVDSISDPISLNATTSTKIADAVSGVKVRREVVVSNNNQMGVWIKEQAASVDNDKKGIFLPGNSEKTLYAIGPIYSGEISAIAEFDNPSITVVEK